MHLWGYGRFAEREAPARGAAGGRALAEFLAQADPAHPHPAEPHPDPDLVLAAAMSALEASRDRHGRRAGIGRAIAEGLAAEGARIVIADLKGAEEAAAAFEGGVGLTVDVARRGGRRADGRRDRRALRRDRHPREQRGPLRVARMRPFDQIPVDEWRQVMDVNVRACS